MKKILSIIICAVILCSCFSVTLITNAQEKIYDTSDFELSSITLTGENMRIGYNFGNVFESTELRPTYVRPEFDTIEEFIEYKERVFGDGQITEDLIKYAKSIGIQAIRVPITWFNVLLDEEGNLYSKDTWYADIDTRRDAWFNGTIAPEFLARIKQVVDWIINNDMYVIINTHHDAACNTSNAVNPIKYGLQVQNSTKYEGMTNQEQTIRYLTNIWTQVGEYFKDYGSKLLFEVYNETTDHTGSMGSSDAGASYAKEVVKSFIKLIRSQGSNNANRFLVIPNYGGVSNWNADIWNGTTTNTDVFEYNQSIPSYDTADDKLIITTHIYQSPSNMGGAITGVYNRMNQIGCGAIVDEIGCNGTIAPYSQEGIANLEIIRATSDKYGVSCFYWDADGSNLINRRYLKPVSCEALGAYVGKDLGEDEVYTNIEQMLDEDLQYWVKLYTPDNENNIWGKKYLIITSENPISAFEPTSSSNVLGYLRPVGQENGFMTFYTSDDDVNYTITHTVYPSAWTKLAWGCYMAYGTSKNTMLVDGTNYCKFSYRFNEDFALTGDMALSEGSDGSVSSMYSGSVTEGQSATFTSNFILNKGTYANTLYAKGNSGSAIVDVAINGQLVAENLDLSTQSGSAMPFELSPFTIAEDNTQIEITVTAKSSGSLYLDYISFLNQSATVTPPVIPETTAGAYAYEINEVSGIFVNKSKIYETGMYSQTDGSKADHEKRIRLKKLIKVTPNTTYSISGLGHGELRLYITAYDENSSFVSANDNLSIVSSTTNYTTAANVEYLGFTLSINDKVYSESLLLREIAPIIQVAVETTTMDATTITPEATTVGGEVSDGDSYTIAEVSGVVVNASDIYETGMYSQSTGDKADHSTRIRTKKLVKVIPNATYTFSGTGHGDLQLYITAYDAEGNFVSAQDKKFVAASASGNANYIQPYTAAANVEYLGLTITIKSDAVASDNLLTRAVEITIVESLSQTTVGATSTVAGSTTTVGGEVSDGDSYTYVAYDNMSGNMNPGSTGKPMTTETDAMSITVKGGQLTKYENYISGYNYAQWQSSTNNINLTFGLKGVEAGVYTLTMYTADNNQARGSFDITANDVALGTINCLDTSLSGKKHIEHALDTQFTANGTDPVTVVVTPATDNKQIFLHSFVLTKVGEVEPESVVSMKAGASIRLNNQNGIRFYTTVDTEKLAELKAVEGNTVELGTLIAPADLVTDELTHEIGKANFIDVKYVADEYYEENTFVGSIVAIKKANYGRAFIGRGYVKVTDADGEVTYYYATQNDNSRSVKAIASAYIADESSTYSSLAENVKNLVDSWAAAADWSAE